MTAHIPFYPLALAAGLLTWTAGAAFGQADTQPADITVAQQEVAADVQVLPPSGPVSQTVQLTASGLPGGEEVRILGGVDPDDLRPLGVARVNRDGLLNAAVEVPDSAVYGQEYYFALAVGGETTTAAVYRVEARQPLN